jgi:hypothetical protein
LFIRLVSRLNPCHRRQEALYDFSNLFVHGRLLARDFFLNLVPFAAMVWPLTLMDFLIAPALLGRLVVVDVAGIDVPTAATAFFSITWRKLGPPSEMTS